MDILWRSTAGWERGGSCIWVTWGRKREGEIVGWNGNRDLFLACINICDVKGASHTILCGLHWNVTCCWCSEMYRWRERGKGTTGRGEVEFRENAQVLLRLCLKAIHADGGSLKIKLGSIRHRPTSPACLQWCLKYFLHHSRQCVVHLTATQTVGEILFNVQVANDDVLHMSCFLTLFPKCFLPV